MRLHATARITGIHDTLIGRVARTPVAASERADTWLLTDDGSLPCDPHEYLGILSLANTHPLSAKPTASGLQQLSYLDDRDVVAVDPNGFV
ncbi:MAG: hypothetical protein ACLGH0_15500, partial [Thermoanaerobaculia bacterium]